MANQPMCFAWTSERPVSIQTLGGRSALSDPAPPHDRSALRLATAERVVAEAYAGARLGGVDADAITIAFAAVRDCLAEARELNQRAQVELDLARRERLQAQQERFTETDQRLKGGRREAIAEVIIADLPGMQFCPDPADATTPAELLDALRQFWVWAGRPSYRVMARQCEFRFAASTMHSALQGRKLPSLDMMLAIVAGCRGSADHQLAFASAWRRLHLQARGPHPGTEARVLRALRDTA